MKKTVLKITLDNKCYSRGGYSAEDDWSLVGEGSTLQEAIDNLISASSKERVLYCIPNGIYVKEIDVIDLEGELYYSKKIRNIKYLPEVLERYGFPPIEVSKRNNTVEDIEREIKRIVHNTIHDIFMNHPRRLRLKKIKDRLDRFEGYLSKKERVEAERKQYERLAKQFGKAP